MGATWITHKGKRILFTDFRPCKTEAEMIAAFESGVVEVVGSKEPVLTYNNFDGCNVTSGFLNHVRKPRPEHKDKIKGKAIVGVTGMKKVYMNTYCLITGIQARACSDEQSALDYLASLP